jgi:hypothetical protein
VSEWVIWKRYDVMHEYVHCESTTDFNFRKCVFKMSCVALVGVGSYASHDSEFPH